MWERDLFESGREQLAETFQLLKEMVVVEVGLETLQIVLECFDGVHTTKRLASLQATLKRRVWQ